MQKRVLFCCVFIFQPIPAPHKTEKRLLFAYLFLQNLFRRKKSIDFFYKICYNTREEKIKAVNEDEKANECVCKRKRRLLI